ncbi:MAG: endospore germination permease [Clostridiales bacterium]|jgi:spore germination protein KB|nr:endospore germination permease [Clostridiales bacterium]
MLEDGRISGRQFTTLIFLIIVSITVLQVPPLLLGLAGQDSVLAVLIAVIIDGVVAAVLYFLGLRYPRKTFIQYSEDILGKIPGKFAAVIFIQFFLLVAALSIRGMSDFLVTIMPETPLTVFIIAFTLVSAFVARGGIESLARMSEIIAPVYIAAIVFLMALLLPEMDFSRVLPLFRYGAKPVIMASLLPASWFGICIIMAMFMAYHHRPEKTFTVKMTGVVMGASVLLLLLIACIAVLGVEYASMLSYPVYILARQISLADFIERVEVIWVAVWLLAGFITISSLHYVSALGTAQLFGLREYRPLVLPLGIMLASFSFLIYPNAMSGVKFILQIFPFYALSIEGGLTTLLFLIALVKLLTNKLGKERRR